MTNLKYTYIFYILYAINIHPKSMSIYMHNAYSRHKVVAKIDDKLKCTDCIHENAIIADIFWWTFKDRFVLSTFDDKISNQSSTWFRFKVKKCVC